jgi:hypothetical protein
MLWHHSLPPSNPPSFSAASTRARLVLQQGRRVFPVCVCVCVGVCARAHVTGICEGTGHTAQRDAHTQILFLNWKIHKNTCLQCGHNANTQRGFSQSPYWAIVQKSSHNLAGRVHIACPVIITHS